MMELTRDTQPTSRGWGVAFTAALLAMFTMQMSSLGFSPLLPAIQAEFRVSYSKIGLFTGLYGIIAILVSFPAGLLIKRIGERRVLGSGLLIVALGLFALSLSHTFASGLSGRMLWLVGYRFSFVAVLTAVAVTCPSSLRGSAMGVLGAVSSLASVIGAPFGSIIASHVNWHRGILGFACMALLGSFQFWILYRRKKLPQSALPVAVLGAVQSTPVYRMPIVWALTLLLGCCNAAGFSASFFVPLALKSVYKLDAVHASYVISAAYIFSIFANLGAGYLVDHFDRWTVLTWVAGASLLASVILNSANLTVFCIAVVLLIGLGLVASNQVFGVAASFVPGANTGPVMGLVSIGSGIFGYVVPQTLGVLRDRTGSFHAGWFLLSAACLVTLVELIWLRARGGRQHAAAFPEEAV